MEMAGRQINILAWSLGENLTYNYTFGSHQHIDVISRHRENVKSPKSLEEHEHLEVGGSGGSVAESGN